MLPAIIGTSAIAGFIISLATKLFDFFIQRTVAYLVVATAVIASVVAIVDYGIGLVGSGMADVMAMFPQWPAELMPLFFPSTVAKACLIAILTAEIVSTGIRWGIWLVKLGKKSFRR